MKKILLVTLLLLSTGLVACSKESDVQDDVKPVITEVAGTQKVFVEGATAPDWSTYISALDNVDGDITITSAMINSGDVDMDTIGTFSVTYIVSDAAGNNATKTIQVTIDEYTEFTIGESKFNYQFDVEYEGELALPNLLEGNGYVVNDDGYAETIYFSDNTITFGNADSWTFVSNGYDKNIHNFVIEAKVMAISNSVSSEAPRFSIRIDYDWMLDVHFNFNNNSWTGIAVHNVTGGSRYSDIAEDGGLALDGSLTLALNTEYVFKIIIVDSDVAGEDTLSVYVDDIKVMETNIPEIDINSQHIMGASAGSHIVVDYFKCNLITVN